MSAPWCVKCNFGTMILRHAHDTRMARGCHGRNVNVQRFQLTHAVRSPRHSCRAMDGRPN